MNEDYKSYAWCKCGDALTRCDVPKTDAEILYNEKNIKTPKNMTFYCFGCDCFFELREINKEVIK